MFAKKAVISILILTSTASSFAYAQSATDTQTVQAKSTTDTQATKVKGLVELLNRSMKLQSLYADNEKALIATQKALVAAEANCLEVCTKGEVSDLLSKVQTLSLKMASIFAAIQFIQVAVSYELFDFEVYDAAATAILKPFSNFGSRMMYGFGALWAATKIYHSFLDNRDSYTIAEIAKLKKDLSVYGANLRDIQANIQVNNLALAQTIKVVQNLNTK